jgi:hypothetical protein
MKGHVTDIAGDMFFGTLDEGGIKYEIEYPKAALADDQKGLLEVGRIFDFDMETEKVLFSNLPDFTEAEKEEARRRAEEMLSSLNWD